MYRGNCLLPAEDMHTGKIKISEMLMQLAFTRQGQCFLVDIQAILHTLGQDCARDVISNLLRCVGTDCHCYVADEVVSD